MIVDEILSPPNNKSGSSNYYNNLLNYVNTRYIDKPRETRAIIMALAYSKYCKEKKQTCHAQLINNPSTIEEYRKNEAVISTIVMGLNTQTNFESYCNDSETVFKKLEKELEAELKQFILTEVKKTINPEVKIIPAILRFIFKKCTIYALQIMIASLWLVLLATILEVITPQFPNFLHKEAQKLLNFDKSPTSSSETKQETPHP